MRVLRHFGTSKSIWMFSAIARAQDRCGLETQECVSPLAFATCEGAVALQQNACAGGE